MISVFTPSHDSRFLDDCYSSLLSQTVTDWEWIVLLNGNVKWKSPDDERVKTSYSMTVDGVGAAKRAACAHATGDILVELDHDDVLLPTCLEAIQSAFDEHPSADFVYSDFAQVNEDLSPDFTRFDEMNGWIYSEVEIDGQTYLHCHSMEPTPHNVSLIWFAPNHARAFRHEAYKRAGGYSASRDILDDQDLMGRLYVKGDFVHIPECLYLQRCHAGNTQRDPELNARIQSGTIGLYDERIESLAVAWAHRNGLEAIDLGAAHNRAMGFQGVDQYPGPGVDIVCDVSEGLPFHDNSVGVIRAHDFLEHIPDKIAIFNEMYRVLAHGGMILSNTPSSDGRGAFQDPTHVSFYNENSFWYFTEEEYAKYVPEITAKFQASRVLTYFPSPWHEAHQIPYVMANLIAVKGGATQGGYYYWPLTLKR
jgi:hypothetical protein